MAEDPEVEVKVVLKQAILRGPKQPNVLQRVATVYIDGSEYRVSAPPDATGDALDWLPHLVVRQSVDINSEVEIHDAYGVLALQAVKEELKRRKQATDAAAERKSAGRASSSPMPKRNQENPEIATPAKDEQSKPKKALDYLTPASFIAAARAADPTFKFAILVAGILGIIVTFAKFGVSFGTLIFGTIVLIALMILYVVFAQAANLAKSKMDIPARVLVWAVLVIVILALIGLTTSAFFNGPLPIRDWIVQKLGTKTTPNLQANRPPAQIAKRTKCSVLAQKLKTPNTTFYAISADGEGMSLDCSDLEPGKNLQISATGYIEKPQFVGFDNIGTKFVPGTAGVNYKAKLVLLFRDAALQEIRQPLVLADADQASGDRRPVRKTVFLAVPPGGEILLSLGAINSSLTPNTNGPLSLSDDFQLTIEVTNIQ